MKSYSRNVIKQSKLDSSIRKVILFLIIVQSCGIRFFDGQGSFLSAIILLILIPKTFYKLNSKDLICLFSITIFLLINKIINSDFEFSKLIFQYLLILQSYFFLKLYKNQNDLILEFYSCLLLIFYHAAATFIIYLLIPGLFKPTTIGVSYYSFLNIFYIVKTDTTGARNTGILWEPGLLQLMLNLLLFYSIKFKKSFSFLASITIILLTTLSTAGFIILGFNIIYFLSLSSKRKGIATLGIIILLFLSIAFSLVFVTDNIADKFSGQNTSGLIRYRDFMIGLGLISEKPFLGHGLFDTSYLFTKPYVNFLESQILSTEYLDLSGSLSGGFTNGLLALFSWYGIPAGILVFVSFYRNKFVYQDKLDRIILFSILCFTFISEPITYTSFFLLFPLSYIALGKYSQKNTNLKFDPI